MKLYWDLDGVLRDLTKLVFKHIPQDWYHKENNEDIFEKINKDLTVLKKSPATEFYKVAIKFPFIKILTCQPEHWKPFTKQWIEKHFSSIVHSVKYLNHQEEKINIIKNENAFLIDDFPFFSDYSRVILIDYPYNRNVRAKIRIRNSKQLDELLKHIDILEKL